MLDNNFPYKLFIGVVTTAATITKPKSTEPAVKKGRYGTET